MRVKVRQVKVEDILPTAHSCKWRRVRYVTGRTVNGCMFCSVRVRDRLEKVIVYLEALTNLHDSCASSTAHEVLFIAFNVKVACVVNSGGGA